MVAVIRLLALFFHSLLSSFTYSEYISVHLEATHAPDSFATVREVKAQYVKLSKVTKHTVIFLRTTEVSLQQPTGKVLDFP